MCFSIPTADKVTNNPTGEKVVHGIGVDERCIGSRKPVDGVLVSSRSRRGEHQSLAVDVHDAPDGVIPYGSPIVCGLSLCGSVGRELVRS